MIERGEDGYFHPESIEQLRALTEGAHQKAVPLRVRGARHSVGAAVHNDHYDGRGAPPDGVHEVMLDRLRQVVIHPAPAGERALVEVEAGCNLGKNPYDPTGTSTWQASLNYQLDQAGYALDDLGGISHQTVSGFMLTGSAGGSLTHTLHDDIERLLLIDGSGKTHDLRRDDPNPEKRDLFHAAGVSMGLLGVIAKVWLRVGPRYDVIGQEKSTRFVDCDIDLLGDGTPDKKSLTQHLRDTPYSRLLWWPQHNFDRMQVWQGRRRVPGEPYEHKPFIILSKADALAGSLLMTIMGNLDDLSRVPAKLGDWYRHLEADLDADGGDLNACAFPQRGPAVSAEDVFAAFEKRFVRAIERHPKLPEGSQADRDDVKELWSHRGDDAPDHEGLPAGLARAISRIVRFTFDGLLDSWIGKQLGKWLAKEMPDLIDNLLLAFVEDGVKTYADSWLCALPMDNQMDDELWPTEFTELWLPIEHTRTAMQRLADYYAANGDVDLAYKRTGTYACELYAASKSDFWLSPAHGQDCFRVDPFWFSRWHGDPNESFFPPIYELLEDLDFRPHWGKHLPPPSADWRAHYRRVLPRLDDFLALRHALDPKDIFLTHYWREHLGIGRR